MPACGIENTHMTSAAEDKPAHSALFTIQIEHIFKFSIEMMNGLVLIERWISPFKIFSIVRVRFC
jgi:hypothetical protein